MNERQRTARERLRVIVAHTPTPEPPVQADQDGARPGLRNLPGLSVRAGRHLTAWLLWHTTRVSLIADAPPPDEFDRAARA
jgi:hypothetical protein